MKIVQMQKKLKGLSLRKKRFESENEGKAVQLRRVVKDKDIHQAPRVGEDEVTQQMIADMFAEYRRIYHSHPPRPLKFQEKDQSDLVDGKESCETASTLIDTTSDNGNSTGSISTATMSTVSSVTLEMSKVLLPFKFMMNGVKTCIGLQSEQSDLECGCNASIIDKYV